MNDGRRQLLPPPMQLLQPGAAARLTTAITRHNARAMGMISDSDQTGQAGGSLACGVVFDASEPYLMFPTQDDGRTIFSHAPPTGGAVVPRSTVVRIVRADGADSDCGGWCGIHARVASRPPAATYLTTTTPRPSFATLHLATLHLAMNSLPMLSFCRLLPAIAAFVALGLALPAGVRADAVTEGRCVLCPAEDVWLVSTRRLPGICRLPARAAFDVERRCGGRWERSDLASLLDDPARPLVIFIHGNRYEPHDAKAQGVTIARQVAAVCPGAAARTVIFSWPSQQQGHIIQSSRETYRRSYADGHYLAWLLGQVDPAQPVAIVGYSFGATIAVGAIEDLMQSGDRPSPGIARWAGRPGRSHLVLVAPAVRSDALAPRGPYAPVVAGIDRLTLVINSRDVALRFFPHLDRAAGADALGAVGMPRRWLPGSVEFTATDASSVVGKRHALPLYLESPSLARRIASGAVAGLATE